MLSPIKTQLDHVAGWHSIQRRQGVGEGSHARRRSENPTWDWAPQSVSVNSTGRDIREEHSGTKQWLQGFIQRAVSVGEL